MKYILYICVGIGVLACIGSVGESDCGTLEIGESLVRFIGGLIVALIGVAGLKVLKEREVEK